ncbi:MAG TPA: hypothetical protein DCR14_07655 [Acidimicrobiaceae bacterium]|nr:hypothetical protein [Acidimicrobiaceae bacterium]
MTERRVRFTEDFFDLLERLLPAERGEDGTPSVTDFLAFEVPPLRDLFAVDVVRVTLETSIPGIRAYIGAGLLVPALLIHVAVDDHDVEAFHLSFGWQ